MNKKHRKLQRLVEREQVYQFRRSHLDTDKPTRVECRLKNYTEKLQRKGLL
jgi:hypothetical protein